MINLRVIIALVCFFAFASIAEIAEAAVISGSVYDLSLRKANNAIVEINSTPKQVMVAQNGSYSFSVPNGFYSINAKLKARKEVIAFVEENISVRQDGKYVLDRDALLSRGATNYMVTYQTIGSGSIAEKIRPV